MGLTRVGLIILGVIAAVVAAYAVFQAFDDRAAPPIVIEDAAADQPLWVDVRGAVSTPGVFTLPPGARVQDAIAAADGLAPSADLATINLARRVRDGEVIYIQQKLVPGSSPVPGSVSQLDDITSESPQKINLNTATVAELDILPGIGVVTAERIVQFREENGPFRSVDELIQVQGISDRTVDEFRDQIT
ncbi:MAG: ComEA family DNA-binding protein, partial [Chloroflexia bacterium]|nr:ComEA family DNA-binding protein [Chloroflexia bacterium]